MCSNKPNPKARKHCEMQCNQNPWYKTIKCVKNDLTIFTTLKILCPVGESDRLPFSPPWESDYWGKVIYCFHHPENLWPLGEGNRSTIFTTLRICDRWGKVIELPFLPPWESDHWGKVIDLPFSPPWESVTGEGKWSTVFTTQRICDRWGKVIYHFHHPENLWKNWNQTLKVCEIWFWLSNCLLGITVWVIDIYCVRMC